MSPIKRKPIDKDALRQLADRLTEARGERYEQTADWLRVIPEEYLLYEAEHGDDQAATRAESELLRRSELLNETDSDSYQRSRFEEYFPIFSEAELDRMEEQRQEQDRGIDLPF